jgi:small conductance mechanosensitive channel
MGSSRVVIVTLVSWLFSMLLAGEVAVATAAPPTPSPSGGTAQSQKPDSLAQAATRKAAVQARLDALGPPGAGQDTQADLRAMLEQTLSTLNAIEQQTQRRNQYQTQLTELPQRVRDTETKRRELLRASARQFPTVDEQVRSEYQTQLQTTLEEIQGLIKETVDGEVRLANIPRELTEHAQQQAQAEQALLTARSEAAETMLQQARLEWLELQVGLHQREGEVLTSEREWLLKRAPLQDELLSFAQARGQRLQQELDSITAALGQEIAAEQATLSATAADITRKMQQALNPVEALQLSVGLETVEIRRQTADSRRRLNEVSELVLAHERKVSHIKQLSDRLNALIEKYAAGEAAGQRLLVLFERLQRERAQYNAAAVSPLDQELRIFNEQLFTLEDTLYEFDYTTEQRLAQLTPAIAKDASLQSGQSGVVSRSLRPLFDEQKNALRDRQQTLAALVQELTKLLTVDQEYKRQLDESQVFALTTLFWVRNNAPLSLNVARKAVAGVVLSMRRGALFVYEEWQRGYVLLRSGVGIGVLGLVALVIIPWLAYRSYRRLRTRIVLLLTNSVEHEELPGWAAATLIVVRSLIWPLYLLFLSWLYAAVQATGPGQESPPFVLTLRFVALLLWLGLLGRAVFRREGWARHYWRLSPEVCRAFARTVLIVTLAAVVCLVPRLLLLTPGSAESAANSDALARLLFLLFQIVVVVMIGVIGRRHGPLAEVMRSGEGHEETLVWHLWSVVYIVVLTALVALILLDVAGYSYASQFLWFRTFSSLTVIFFVRLLFVHGLPWVVNTSARIVVGGFRRNLTLDEQQNEAARYFGPAFSLLGRGVISLAAVVVLLEVWGLPVRWVLTSPTLWQVITRGSIIALTVGVTLVVLRASSFITNSFLSSPTGGGGYEVGRKLKTLAPLVQTLLRVGVVFAATLVVLEQLGIATGPVLAGAGIFGLAIGFASQSLIKDVINGLFILFEDSLSVGDVVRVHGTGGQVEKFTLRAVTLRDLAGNVHVIPNSVIDSVTNMTKDYSRYVLDVGIAYHENVDTVIAVLREIDEGMRKDADYGRDMLEPLEVLGLERFDASAVVIRARLKTRPVQQWRIGREFNRRIKQVFDERGIEIPFPQQTIHWVVPQESAPKRSAVLERKDSASPSKGTVMGEL